MVTTSTIDAETSRRLQVVALHSPLTLGMWTAPHSFVPRAHLRLISQAFAETAQTPGGRLMIFCPPQCGKSVTAATYGVAWYLLRNPSRRVAVGTYSDSLARHRGRDVRAIITEHGHRWGVGVARGSASTADWRTHHGGGLRSVGVGSSLTGFPADLVLVDDPHKDRQSADSSTQRTAVWGWWSSVATSRLSPGAPAVIIQTRWHRKDLSGLLLEREGRVEDGGRWRVVSLPAFAQAHDSLGRAPGQPLSHPKLPEDDLAALTSHWEDKRASSIPRDWSALYMCTPIVVEGALLPPGLLSQRVLRPGRRLPKLDRVCVAVDPSGGGSDECGIVAAGRGLDGRVYLLADRSGVMSPDQWARTVCLLAAETRADSVVIEQNYGGGMVRSMVNSAWQELGRKGSVRPGSMAPYVTTVTAKRGKYLRAEPIAQAFVQDRVRLAHPMPELEGEWEGWTPASPDSPGRLDASAYAVAHLMPYASPQAPTP